MENNKPNLVSKLRKANKLTQEELAELIGITRPHLSNIENGKVYPGGRIVTDLSSLFGKSPEVIFFEKCVHQSEQTIA